MDLPTLKREYAYELKESFFRRLIANAIDAFIISVVVFFLGGFIIAGITNSNPMGIFFGLAGDAVMKTESGDLKQTPLFTSMIGFAAVYFVVSALYYGVFESGNRKTAGKAMMHLSVVSYVRDPNFLIAVGRNLSKILGGAFGGYLLGIIGANVGAALATYIDYVASPASKVDIRQRLSEKSYGTVVLTENDENDVGSLAVDGAPTIEEALKGTFEKHKKPIKPASALPDKGAKGFGKAIGGGSETKEERSEPASQDRPAFGRSIAGSLSGDKGAAKETEKSSAPSAPAERSVEDLPSASASAPAAPSGKNETRDRAVLEFMMEFDIDEARAQLLYDTGYRKKEDLSEAIPEDLVMLKGINPTIARRIVSRANSG